MPRALIGIIVCISLCGCGTFSDELCGPARRWSCDPAFYRGVSYDMRAIEEGDYFMAADLPFSALADTLLLPFAALDSGGDSYDRRP